MKIEAVVFDMDGTLIETAHIWKAAEREVFSSLGVEVNESMAGLTESMTTAEVTDFWYRRYPWARCSKQEAEMAVVSKVQAAISKAGEAKNGVYEVLGYLKNRNVKLALASNAPRSIISTVLSKLKIHQCFEVVVSAEDVEKGKPHPLCYQLAAQKLGVATGECLAIEDSDSGVTAAKRAGMRALAVSSDVAKSQLGRFKPDGVLPDLSSAYTGEFQELFFWLANE